ncbi:MAG: carbohydrate-binding family 9-like protein [Pyrinomonadaceae bacterium]
MELNIQFIDADFDISETENASWSLSADILIDKYWSGESAPRERQSRVKLLWSDNALYVRFKCSQFEPLVISEDPDPTKKTKGLWDRDVCEIFIAPDPVFVDHYFEFEAAPTGEWIDLEIEKTGSKRSTSFDYNSGMTSAAQISGNEIIIAMKLPFAALSKVPVNGDAWRGNLFRIIGEGSTRGYLAWCPTETAVPDFHVPGKFGKFHFVK